MLNIILFSSYKYLQRNIYLKNNFCLTFVYKIFRFISVSTCIFSILFTRTLNINILKYSTANYICWPGIFFTILNKKKTYSFRHLSFIAPREIRSYWIEYHLRFRKSSAHMYSENTFLLLFFQTVICNYFSLELHYGCSWC